MKQLFQFIFSILIIISFSQCHQEAEKSLIAPIDSPVNPYKFPGEKYTYVKTYSINRTWDVDSLFGACLDRDMSKVRNDVLDDRLEHSEDALMGDFWIGERSIYNSKGKKAKTAQLIKKLTSEEIENFRKLMIKDHDNMILSSYCYHTYRDAIVFYNNNDKPVGWINFCFSCGDLNSNWRKIYDYEQDSLLSIKQFFINLGHPILEDKD